MTKPAQSTFEIKVVNTDQLNELRDMVERTFMESFAHRNTVEDMAIYGAQAFSEPQIQKEYEAEGAHFYFLYFGGTLAGYLKLNVGEAQTELLLENAVEIERIYLLRPFQRKGLGQGLFDFSMQFAKARKADWLWLGVWDQNDEAIEFYQRQGMREFATHEFHLGHDLQTDLLMMGTVK